MNNDSINSTIIQPLQPFPQPEIRVEKTSVYYSRINISMKTRQTKQSETKQTQGHLNSQLFFFILNVKLSVQINRSRYRQRNGSRQIFESRQGSDRGKLVRNQRLQHNGINYETGSFPQQALSYRVYVLLFSGVWVELPCIKLHFPCSLRVNPYRFQYVSGVRLDSSKLYKRVKCDTISTIFMCIFLWVETLFTTRLPLCA